MTPRVVTLGESMGLVRGVGIGGFERLASAAIDTGGAEGNLAIGLARLGVHATWLGRVGDDALGRRVVGDLRSEGVDVVAVVDPGASTGMMLKSTPRSGVTVVDYYRAGSAGSRLAATDLDAIDIASYDALHLTGITPALSPSAAAAVVEAATRARAAGVLVSFDVNHRSRLWTRAAASGPLSELADLADLVFAGEDEIGLLVEGSTGGSPERIAHTVAESTGAEVVLKRGARGALVVARGEATEIEAVPVEVVDTVGAGDAFAAAYLAERLLGSDLGERLRVAAIAGAFACAHPGDWQGFARRDELRRIPSDPVER